MSSSRKQNGILVTLATILVGGLLLSCSSGCSPAEQGPAPNSCGSGQVNELGVGQPCQVRQDCTGKSAVTCPVANDPDGYTFCTRACFKLMDDECGANAECVFYKQGRGQCVPSACKDKFPEPEFPEFEKVQVPCCVGKVNDLGVGTPCTQHSDCAGIPAASCPMRIDSRLPNWCSFLCTPGDDCGEGAFCWWRPSVVEMSRGGAAVLVGSCAPLKCRVAEEPEACDPNTAVGGPDASDGDTPESPKDHAAP